MKQNVVIRDLHNTTNTPSTARALVSGSSHRLDLKREENARRASQQIGRVFRDLRCGSFHGSDEFEGEIADEPVFEAGRYYSARSRRRQD